MYTLGAEGNLICFDAAGGKIVWEKDLKKEYKTRSALWGYAAHPLIDGKKLVTLAEPLTIVVFGSIVGFVALSLLQAIYSVNAGAFR